MNKASPVLKYLDRYTDAESREAARHVIKHKKKPFDRALCVPVFDEDPRFLQSLAAHPDIDGTLVVLVINAPQDASPNARKRTLELLELLCTRATSATQSGHAFMSELCSENSRCPMLVMDYCSAERELPPGEGVGLARKLGNDVALELWHEGYIQSPWLYQTDADATLPDNYFSTPPEVQNSVAQHLNFVHYKPGGVSLAQSLYDLKLDYYVAGLSYAGSPYCHYSLGSAMVIHAKAYATVRGYPKRNAGEDFYLLDKLAKCGDIYFDRTRTVTLSERLSSRVPFGTGPGVARFEAMANPLKACEYYAPNCFEALKIWLVFLNQIASKTQEIRTSALATRSALRLEPTILNLRSAMRWSSSTCLTGVTEQSGRTRAQLKRSIR